MNIIVAFILRTVKRSDKPNQETQKKKRKKEKVTLTIQVQRLCARHTRPMSRRFYGPDYF